MKNLLKRMKRSPRLRHVLFAVTLPCAFCVYFAPWWAIVVSGIACIWASMFIYSAVLSPKFTQATKSSKTDAKTSLMSRPERTNEPSDDNLSIAHLMAEQVEGLTRSSPTNHLTQAQETFDLSLLNQWTNHGYKLVSKLSDASTGIKEILDWSDISATTVAESIRALQKHHRSQLALMKELIAQTETTRSAGNTLSNLAFSANDEIERQSQAIHQAVQSAQALSLLQEQVEINLKIVLARLEAADRLASKYESNSLRRIEGMGSVQTVGSEKFSHDLAQDFKATISDLDEGLAEIRKSMSSLQFAAEEHLYALRLSAKDCSAEHQDKSARLTSQFKSANATTSALRELASESEQAIDQAVVAIQYHDITSQKLQSIKTNYLEVMIRETQSVTASTLLFNQSIKAKPLAIDVPRKGDRDKGPQSTNVELF